MVKITVAITTPLTVIYNHGSISIPDFDARFVPGNTRGKGVLGQHSYSYITEVTKMHVYHSSTIGDALT